MVLDVDGFDGRVCVEKFGDEEIVPCGGNLHHFLGSKRVFVASQDADDQLQLRVEIEYA